MYNYYNYMHTSIFELQCNYLTLIELLRWVATGDLKGLTMVGDSMAIAMILPEIAFSLEHT